jgi:2-polyprenyl-3-methyl-5-hydroxy-6-metoxy-1,4-benzoquinol methylase
MQPHQHWESVYTTKSSKEVSWYRPHLETSLALINRLTPDRASAILDVGAGESTLIDDLLQRGYTNLTALDVSETALRGAQERLGQAAAQVNWLAADVCEAGLSLNHYDIWHDRAVFHFLTQPEQRLAYVTQASRSLNPGAHIIIATFGPEGPTRCSGLPVVRYDAASLQREFDSRFRLLEDLTEDHTTPSGASQQFLYCVLQKLT